MHQPQTPDLPAAARRPKKVRWPRAFIDTLPSPPAGEVDGAFVVFAAEDGLKFINPESTAFYMQWMATSPTGPTQMEYSDENGNFPMRGLGDLVAVFAKPIAEVFGLEGCGGCAQRQETLNEAFPFKKS